MSSTDSRGVTYCIWAAVDEILYNDKRKYLKDPGVGFEQLAEMQIESILSDIIITGAENEERGG